MIVRLVTYYNGLSSRSDTNHVLLILQRKRMNDNTLTNAYVKGI